MDYTKIRGEYWIECLNFKEFFENIEGQHTTMQVHIPMPSQVEILSNLFHKQGLELKPVGGAVRDYLFAHFHGDIKKYNPKDVDLATNASPDQVESLLQSPEAQRYGIKVIPKGKAFGVISAVFPLDPTDPSKNQEYEIATYREEWYDPEGPGRRPDDVRFSTAAADAKRRDLTMNALFYDPKSQQVIDYNVNAEGKGQGIEDIRNRIARFVGNPRERIREDKLRILRLIRFFSRYNPGEIAQHMDQETLRAIEDFKHLAGVSPERITNEFLGGLEKAINPVNYLKNYMSVGRDSVSHPYGLLSMVFPNMKIDVGDIDRIGHVKNPKAILAWLLKGNSDVVRKLRDSKYPSDIFDVVDFLLKIYRFNPNNVSGLLSKRDIYKQEKNEKSRHEKKSIMQKDIMDFAKIANMEDVLGHFVNYQRQANAKDFMHLKGAEIGKAMANHETNAYLKSMG